MDNDLNDKLEQFLSRPDSMEKIQTMLASFGSGENRPDAPPPTSSPASGGMPDFGGLPDLNTLSNLGTQLNLSDLSNLSALSGMFPEGTLQKLAPLLQGLGSLGKSEGAGGSDKDPDGTLQKLAPLLQGLGGLGKSEGGGKVDKDPNVALLHALRPYLHDGREKRVDEAIEMMQLVKLLPLLNIKL